MLMEIYSSANFLYTSQELSAINNIFFHSLPPEGASHPSTPNQTLKSLLQPQLVISLHHSGVAQCTTVLIPFNHQFLLKHIRHWLRRKRNPIELNEKRIKKVLFLPN
jgi:hypothetical protein